jgi:hypothetical protein
VINEVLAHSHGGAPDWIELYNPTAIDVNISGWYLSDSDVNLTKYQIAAGTIVNVATPATPDSTKSRRFIFFLPGPVFTITSNCRRKDSSSASMPVYY